MGASMGGGSPDAWAAAAEKTAQGNLKMAQAATAANRVNQNTAYGNLNYSQNGTDSMGNPTWSASQTLAQPLQGAVDNTLNNLDVYKQNFTGGNLPSYGINPGQEYSDAIMQRLQPTLQRQQEAQDSRLANQGITAGTDAYNRAQTLLGQTQNDARTSAIVGGMDVGLRANNQQFNQNLQTYNNPLAIAQGVKGLTSLNLVTPYNQAATAGPDYLGAAALSNQNAIQNQNMANANRANMQSGLYGLGAAALQGGAGDYLASGLKNVVGGVSDWWKNQQPQYYQNMSSDYQPLDNYYNNGYQYDDDGYQLPQ